MIEIIAITMGLIALVRGKFTLKKDKVLIGWRARLCGCLLLCHVPIVAVAGIVLNATNNLEQTTALTASLASLATVIVSAYVLGFSLYRGQETTSSPQPTVSTPF